MPLFLNLSLGLSGAMAGGWVMARRPGRSGWMDVVWSYATGLAGAAGALLAPGGAPAPRHWLLAGVALCWGLRLGTHIWVRGRGLDDPRYVELLREWGPRADLRLFLFAQVQAVAALVLVSAIVAAAGNPAPLGQWSDWAGLAVLALALGGEAIADAQLAAFRADPAHRGAVCETGLWSLSRHPNYFFEWLGWLAWPLIAIGPSGDAGWRWLALGAPAFMYVLLVHVSGIPPLEAHMLRGRGEAFARSQRRISAFWPIPRRTFRASECTS